LGSGSRGNATVVRRGRTVLLIDCGFGLRAAEARLAALGIAAAEITAVLVTHEHTDHLHGVGPLARRHNLPVWLTRGTHRAGAAALGALPACHYLCGDAPVEIGDLACLPVTVPHDAREPVQYVIGDGASRLGILTDVGRITPHIVTHFSDLDALLLEFNHDLDLLQAGSYPPALKARIAGGYGHLSNPQSAAGLRALAGPRLQHLVALHLSEQNNAVALARAEAAAALACPPEWVGVAAQDGGFPWREILPCPGV
jgi:phosphoribosyl 1,2-cyclic phosphodiesterase